MSVSKLGLGVMGMAALWLALVGAGRASGTLPFIPVTETLPDFAACLARLEELAKADKALVMPRQTDAQGLIREVTLDTKGPVTTGPEAAQYEATLWFHSGRADPALKQIETSHSYATRISRCDHGTLTIEGSDGYTLSTFDPLP